MWRKRVCRHTTEEIQRKGENKLEKKENVVTRGEVNNLLSVGKVGYVRLIDTLGSDLTVVNAARVSYAKESKELSEKDTRLIRFLGRENHTSPFRHAVLQFEVYAPLMVARQWWKYIIGSHHQEGIADSLNAWNESSRRYITEEVELYTPEAGEWRSAPENSKQGSGEPFDTDTGGAFTESLKQYQELGKRLYNSAVAQGVAVEQARLFLPAYGLYVRWYWTASLQSVFHFVDQRTKHDAQSEIRDYAKAVETLAKEHFPESFVALGKK